MKNVFFNYNGKVYSESDLPIDFRNRAFSLGDGFFESMHYGNGEVQLFDYHVERMRGAAQLYRMAVPFLDYPQLLHGDIVRLVNANKFFKGVRIRLQIYRKGAGLYTPESSETDYLISCEALQSNEYQWNKEGLKVTLFRELVKPTGSLYSFKSMNPLISIRASLYKKEKGVDNSLLINEDQRIIEAANANVFFIKNSTVFTPEIKSGCVAGVMRRHIIHLLTENNYKIQEITGINPSEIANFDEIFISNAIQGIQWVSAIGNHRYYNDETRKIYFLLLRSLFYN